MPTTLTMKKNYVLDTNILLHDPRAIFRFEDNDVIIPIYCIEEVDQFKKEGTERGRNAREIARILDRLRELYGEEDLRIVFKNQPLPFHEHAKLAAAIGQAVLEKRGGVLRPEEWFLPGKPRITRRPADAGDCPSAP